MLEKNYNLFGENTMTKKRACANAPVLSRRTALTALAASPIVAAMPRTLQASSGSNKTSLELKYMEWLSARYDLNETIEIYLPDGITDGIEANVLEPLYERLDALEAEIVKAPCRTASDLAVKLLTIMHTHKETYSEDDVDRMMSDAQRLVNLTDIA